MLEMSEQTYRRLLSDPQSVRMSTKRRAREVLGVSPFLVEEFYPTPSATLLSYVQAAADQADNKGWITYEAEEFNLTSEHVDGGSRTIMVRPRLVFSPTAYDVLQQLDDLHRRRFGYALAIAATGQGGVPGGNGFEWITCEDTHVVYRRSDGHVLQITLIEIRTWQPLKVDPRVRKTPNKDRKKQTRSSKKS